MLLGQFEEVAGPIHEQLLIGENVADGLPKCELAIHDVYVILLVEFVEH